MKACCSLMGHFTEGEAIAFCNREKKEQKNKTAALRGAAVLLIK
jgi:hypothetical protein